MRKWAILSTLGVILLSALAASAQISPPFNQCPPVGADTSCAILIVVTDKSVNVYSDPSQGPYDMIEDTLIGVQNNSSGKLYSLPLSSPNPIFTFDNDGICGIDPNTGQPYNPAPPCTWPAPYTYEGPNTSFSGISGDQTSGIVNFPAGLASGASTYFSLELAIQTVCPTLSGNALGVPLQKQFTGYPGAWGGNVYDDYPAGDKTHTMRALGCATTSSSMLINYFGGSTDPGALNTWLANNNGYLGHAINWLAVAKYATSVLGVPLAYQPGTATNDFVVDNYLCANDPVILQVQSPHGTTHFVVATGGEARPSGASTFLLNDPGYNCSTLDQGGCSYNNQYQGIRKFSPGGAPMSGLLIQAGSPVSMLVVAPNGQETGLNPVTGNIVQQIPASDYYTESIGDDTGAGANTPPVEKIEIGTPASGQYTLQVTGTGNGSFTLWFVGYDTDANSSIQTVTGTVTTGQVFGYGISYSSVPGSQITLVPVTLAPPNGNSCNGTYSGTFKGDITISKGQNCTFMGGGVTGNVTVKGGNLVLNNAAIGGNFQVNGGGTFSLGSSTTIKGNLQVQNIPAGAAQNQVCATSIGGDLQFQNNGTAVEIGSSGFSCPGNVIGGNLQVQNNTAATVMYGNTVAGNLQDQNNTASTQVFHNAVTHNLQCQNNTSITGGGNTAAQKQGQCASF